MTARHAAAADRRPGERLVRAGAIVFALGLLATLAAVVPFLVRRESAPLELTLVAALLPVGLGTALVGLLRGARAARRSSTRS